MRGHIVVEAEVPAVAERVRRKNWLGCRGFGLVV
jgi:hypothetical protein